MENNDLFGDPAINVIDLTEDGTTARSLCEILNSCQNFKVHHRKIDPRIPSCGKINNEWDRIFGSSEPDLFFLVPPRGDLDCYHRTSMLLDEKYPRTSTILIIASTEFKDMINYIKGSIDDFVITPLKNDDILLRIWRHVRTRREDEISFQMLKERVGLKLLIGRSPDFLKEVEKIPAIARCGATVLISGETGTGKEMFARAIHYLGPRAGKPFVPVNCGAIPADLMERELFGHIKGAFTGADSSQPGLISEADGGTIFLDEIDCLPMNCQVKLLRFLQDKVYRQLGSPKSFSADVHISAATNIDIPLAVEKGTFRSDLFYRLNLIPISLPPLNKRREDIPLLINHFIEQYAYEYNKKTRGISDDTMEELIRYEWPGNVRELEYVIARAIILSDRQILTRSCIPLPERYSSGPKESMQSMKKKMVAEFEKNYIESLLVLHEGNISKAARFARTNRRQFFELIRKHGITVKRYRGNLSA